MQQDLIIGSHISMRNPDYLVGSINEALANGANALMIYTGPPQSTIRTNINNLKINEFIQILKQNNIDLKNVIVHAPYIINLGSGDLHKQKFAINFINEELNRVNKIGAKYFVLHPGNATNCSRDEAIKNIANSLNKIFDLNKSNTVACLETMSGKGTEIGKSFEELKQIIDLINDKNRIGVCLDTCHINDAGYDLNNFDQVLNQFDQIIGLNYLHVIHLNDSMNDIGTHKDRHENIGYGTIGFNILNQIAHHPKLVNIPKILETPWLENKCFYKDEIAILKSQKWKQYK